MLHTAQSQNSHKFGHPKKNGNNPEVVILAFFFRNFAVLLALYLKLAHESPVIPCIKKILVHAQEAR